MHIEFHPSGLTAAEQSIVSQGFQTHSREQDAPEYEKKQFKWLVHDERHNLRAVLTANTLWDWLYIDELWVCPTLRGDGLGAT